MSLRKNQRKFIKFLKRVIDKRLETLVLFTDESIPDNDEYYYEDGFPNCAILKIPKGKDYGYVLWALKKIGCSFKSIILDQHQDQIPGLTHVPEGVSVYIDRPYYGLFKIKGVENNMFKLSYYPYMLDCDGCVVFDELHKDTVEAIEDQRFRSREDCVYDSDF